MISVVIPTYNRSALLGKAIESVLAQTMPCAEIIVVDDGSSDATRKLVNTFKSQHKIPIRYFFQNNRGAAAARNKGISEARHDILCFLDSDDCFVSNKIEEQLGAMEKEPQYLISLAATLVLETDNHEFIDTFNRAALEIIDNPQQRQVIQNKIKKMETEDHD